MLTKPPIANEKDKVILTVKTALSVLNDQSSLWALADALKTAGCKGKRHSAYYCPVNLWLQRALKSHEGVAVATGQTEVTIRMPGEPISITFIQIPRHVQRFIAGFDEGGFDYLEIPRHGPNPVVG